MGVEHALVYTTVVTTGAAEWLGAIVISEMVLQMVLVFSHENALGTKQKLLWLDVTYV